MTGSPEAVPLLRVEGLRVEFPGAAGPAVHDAGFEVAAGETVGLVGESGAGKTMTGLALLGLVPRPGRISGGRVLWQGEDLLRAPEGRLRRVRGGEIGLAFQDPGAALHPSMTVLAQVAEAIRAHQPGRSRRAALDAADALLDRLGVSALHRHRLPWPHQWSGGMRQRGLLAIALANHPALLVADEPTTGLDVVTERQILELLKDVRAGLTTSVLLTTHDMAVIGEMADRVVVMLQGRVVEQGPVAAVLQRPGHPYTLTLLGAPGSDGPGTRPARGCVFADRCPIGRDRAVCRERAPEQVAVGGDARHRAACHFSGEVPPAPAPQSALRFTGRATAPPPLLAVDRLRVAYRHRRSLFRRDGVTVAAVDGVSFGVGAGETLGLVGESGCGKSSLARALVRLEEPADGRVVVDGRDITHVRGAELRRARASIQIVFQNPFTSLNPRRRVGDSIAHPLLVHGRGDAGARSTRVVELLDAVRLPPAYAHRWPHELSGGERQRVAIARALALGPRILVLDEPVSSLDGSTRAGVLGLLRRLQEELGHACLFIAHDLEAVAEVAHRVAVMYLGRIVEVGRTEDLFRRPRHPYTRALLAAAPDRARPHRPRGMPLAGEVPDASAPPSGCRFRTRCPRAETRCAEEEPALVVRGTGHPAACHFAEEVAQAPLES